MPRPCASDRALAMRAERLALSAGDFSGFCGDTSQITLSRRRRFIAVSATWAWPSCAGLNEPPNRPTRIPRDRKKPGRRVPILPAADTRLAGPEIHISDAGPDRFGGPAYAR